MKTTSATNEQPTPTSGRGAITSKEELNARLQRDANDPLALQIVSDIRALMRRTGVSREKAIAAYFQDQNNLAARLAVASNARDDRTQKEVRRLMIAFTAFASLGFLILILWSEPGFDRNTYFALWAGFLGLSLFLYHCGNGLQQFVARRPVATLFGIYAAVCVLWLYVLPLLIRYFR